MTNKPQVALKCPACKKRSFKVSKKEGNIKHWFCYLCKYSRTTGGQVTIIKNDVETKKDDERNDSIK